MTSQDYYEEEKAVCSYNEFVQEATEEFCGEKQDSIYVERAMHDQPAPKYKYSMDYVNKVRWKHEVAKKKKGIMMDTLGRFGIGNHPQLILARLKALNPSFDVQRRICRVPMCGRSFKTISVLAYHVCYAHQNQSSRNPMDLFCYLCGKVFPAVKSKLMHLAMHHRKEMEMHNQQCIVQSHYVIAPTAPEALRLGDVVIERIQDEDEDEERELTEIETMPTYLNELSFEQPEGSYSFSGEGQQEPEFGVPFVIHYTQ